MTGARSTRNCRRHVLCVAQDIHEALTTQALQPAPVSIPEYLWNELLRLHRLSAKARERRFSSAAEKLDWEMIGLMQSLSRQLNEACVIQRCARNRSGSVSSLHDVYRDLCYLEAEFDEVRIDAPHRTITVRTDSIVLEELNLGPFDIALHWSRSRREPPYEVIPVRPVYCVQDDSVSHPHVKDNCLCAGDGKVPIASALEQGRLLEFFILVRQVLLTYSPGSAFQQIEEWFDEDSECSECGCCLDGDTQCECERCGSRICYDCTDICHVCESMCCRQCTDACVDCDEYVCMGCSELNASRTARRCRDCIEQETESTTASNEENDDEAEEEKAETTPASTAVYARCVGEVAVPA